MKNQNTSINQNFKLEKSTFINSKWADFISIVMIGALVPLVLFFGIRELNQAVSLVVLFILVIPTIFALIKGAPFVPTPFERVEKMVAAAGVNKKSVVYDLGCGDGRIVFVAANKYGAKAIGYELSPLVFLLAKIRQIFWGSKAKIIFGNFKRQDLSDANVVFCYLLPEAMEILAKKFNQELKVGSKVISYSFELKQNNFKLIETIKPSKDHGRILIYEKIAVKKTSTKQKKSVKKAR